MTATEHETGNVCGECGGPARVFDLMGVRIPMRYCQPCGDRIYAAEIQAEREGSVEKALRRAGGTTRLLTMTLDSHPDAQAAGKARDWLAGWHAGERRNLWLAGPVGLGKTGLAWGIVRSLTEAAVARFWQMPEELRGVEPTPPAMLLRWADLLDDLRAAFDSDRRAADTGETADPSLILERAKRIPVLALDDLGRERPTPWALEKLANLVETRYGDVRPTIVTSNYGGRELAVRLDASGVDGERIVSRLIDGAVTYRFEGSSRRRLA
jgi:DNA replication protein DnaC